MSAVHGFVLLASLGGALVQQPASGQEPPATPPAAQSAEKPAEKPATAFSTEQLEQIVAPIALYPDPLLMQVCMAATYPIEVVQAGRWVAANPGKQAAELESALKTEDWDPSVKSLCGFPDALKHLSDNLDWTQDLGDAFLGQRTELLDTVQHMRKKALDAGQLKTTPEQTVTVKEDQIIVVQPANPQVIYVPTYSPTVVYGSWSYPHWYYPPLYYPPPPGAVAFSFAVGVAWGAAMWGGCSWGWGHSDVDIDINNYNNFTENTDIDGARNKIQEKAGGKGDWKHDPAHRGGVNYRDGKTAQQYGGERGSSRVSRDQARGYGPSDRAGSRGGSGTAAARTPATRTPATREAARPAADRSGLDRGGAGSRPSTGSGRGDAAFSGSRNASYERAASSRGSMSRGGGGRAGGGRGGGRRG